ncbi:MAG: hypothetical protein LBG80_19040 [Bacteroidales bacterium]|jgi:hypothetical protein|nr:hypothetical protein [Bacteroidales bacterium]
MAINTKKSVEILNYYNSASESEKELFNQFVELLEEDVYINHMSYIEAAQKHGYYQSDILENRTKAISANSIADFIFKAAWEFWYYSVLEGIIEKEINRFSDVNDTKKRFWMFLTVFLIIIAIIK